MSDEPVPNPTPPAAAEPEEPDIRGTLLFGMLLLMLIFGFWAVLYVTLLQR